MDLNELVLESITFDDGDPLEGSFLTLIDAKLGLDIEEEEEDGGENSGSGSDLMILTWRRIIGSDDYEILPSTVIVSSLFCICLGIPIYSINDSVSM